MTDQVLVYRLVEASRILAHGAALAEQLQAHGPGRALAPSVHVTSQGCFKYFDRGRLLQGAGRSQLPDERGAIRAAADYMRAVNDAAERYRQDKGLKKSDYPSPFPLGALKHGGTRQVLSSKTRQVDHWLSIWLLHLAYAPALSLQTLGSTAPVIGATVELRVGAHGQVIGLVSTVRPWDAVITRRAFAPPPADEGDHGQGGGQSQRPALEMAFIAEGPEDPQRFLSPCYVDVTPREEGHEDDHNHASFWPACDYSILPEIIVEQSMDGKARARALVLEGAGRTRFLEHGKLWRIEWSSATLDGFESGEATRMEGTELALDDPGVYHVELSVEHLPTQAMRTTYMQIPVPRPRPTTPPQVESLQK